MGLSISKAFVEKLGGKIWLKSVPDKGSTFFFNIPYKTYNPSASTMIQTNEDSKFGQKPKILVVEDEDYNYLYIEEVLLDLDIELLHAKSGKEAVDICRSNRQLRLILMDIKLPDFNGFEALNQIRGILPDIPIVAQTAYALSGDKEIAIEMGFTDYIAKPIDESELIKKVQQYTERISE